MDIISNLPIQLIDAILIRIPLVDAVRTSILSSKWRDKWVIMSQLVIDYQCLPHHFKTSKFVSVVDKVLLRHQGSLQKFNFCYNMPSISELDQWIIYLSGKGVKELIIDVIIDDNGYVNIFHLPYEISSRIYSCQEISSLKLCGCVIKPLPSFQVFPNLRSLTLLWCNCDIGYLISKCPLLERLTFEPCSFTSINIKAPNLKYLKLFGPAITSICFECSAPLLSEMFIGLFDDDGGSNQVIVDYTFLGSVCHFPNIRNLNLGTLTYVGFFDLPLEVIERLPTSLCNLETLKVEMDFLYEDVIGALLCLLRSSPGLLKLSWHSRHHYPLYPGEDSDQVEEVLANSPVLRKMTIRMKYEEAKIWKALQRFKRASAEAEIVWLP